MYYTIYKITNKINGNFYIGKHKTKNLNDSYMGSGKLIKAAIRKHGIENFEKEILETFNTEEEMNEAEKRYVVLGEGSYNLCPGGQGGWGYVNTNGLNVTPMTEERLKKHSKTASKIRKEQLLIEENLIKFKEITALALLKIKELYPNGTFYGKKHSEETLQKMRKPKNIGPSNSQYGTMWITNGFENKKIKKDSLDEFTKLGYYKGRIT
jgi:group I intron endonuclease